MGGLDGVVFRRGPFRNAILNREVILFGTVVIADKYWVCGALSCDLLGSCFVLLLLFQIAGSVRGEELPYVFGLPLVSGQPFFPHNYSHQDMAISRLLMHYIGNFARKG